MKITLGKFARSGIEEVLGANLAVGLQEALTHYTRRLESNWKPVRPPQFDWPQAGPVDVFELKVAPELEAALEREAFKQQVPLDQILVHAVLVYLADLESAGFSVGDAAIERDPSGDPPPSVPAV